MKSPQTTDFGTLGREAREKLQNDNDIKIIIQGSNSQTGIGKTTLAIQLCRYIDPEWNAKEKSFIDVSEYLNAHLDMPKGTALLLDEIEHGADSRRSMSNENVSLSQGWAKLRARNIATVCTLPSTSMLDKRMLELADYWVLVKQRGVAQPYRIVVNDFKPSKLPKRKPLPGDEHIQFSDLPARDKDKRYLDKIKDEAIRSESLETIKIGKHEAIVEEEREKAVKDARMDLRDEWMSTLHEETDMTYEAISNLSVVDRDRSTVYQAVQSWRDENEE